MAKLNPIFGTGSFWDGTTNNPDRVDENSNLDPDLHDWDRISAEVQAMQPLVDPRHSGVEVTRSTSQTISSGVATAISYTAITWDTDDYWALSPNPTRLTVPTDGVYMFFTHIKWDADSNGKRVLDIRMNGTTFRGGQSSPGNMGAGDDPDMSTMWAFPLNAGQYVEVLVFHDAVGSLDVTNSQFSIVRLMDLTNAII